MAAAAAALDSTQHGVAEHTRSFLLTLVQLEGGISHGVEYLLSLQYVDVP